MHLTRRVRLQLAIFCVITLVGGAFMVFSYLDVPRLLWGGGHYRVDVELPNSAGLYVNSNVTYRGVEVGRVDSVALSDAGVTAQLSINSDAHIPADLDARVHSQSAIGEQFIELVPRSGKGPSLKNGDVIPAARTSIPPDVNKLLTITNAGLTAIPNDNLRTAIDESFTAIGGLGPELSRLISGTTALTADARKNLDSITTLIDDSKPVMDSQIDTADSIQAWAANLAQITSDLEAQNGAFAGVLNNGPDAFDQTRALFDRLNPTLPILAANMASLADVAVVYQANIEQILVLAPQVTAGVQSAELPDRYGKYPGINLSLNANINLPPPCTTGFLPPNQARSASEVDYPTRPAGDMYCRVPQDSPFNVRGARNIPCETRPGKRAATVKECESDRTYVPLNDGYNWKGDANATLTGQPIPEPPPQPPVPVAAATYDPATGKYFGPDGQQYTQSDLSQSAPANPTWQDMLVPKGNDR
ncbi:MCE family protein [Mycolicibacterium stellerae]|uniref:MCE family protein n=1 Tax=Mycolicibacterium stellerae TaxID=2358193 RepID=UPI000F0B84E9|nr:MlaD family protein [Mycolicibacterium stellerae]